jgi:putative ABC transport system ATP-binding protein
MKHRMIEPVLVIANGLNKRYQMGGTTIQALSNVSLRISRGEFIAIVGRSGSGKSTLMSILGLLDRPDSGRYVLNGREVAELEEDARASIRNREIGFVFQAATLLPRSTALQNVEMPLSYARIGDAERRRRVRAALDRVGLSHRAMHWPSQLSGGEQQRVAIARALVNDPVLILADEPTGALDSKTADSVLSLFEELNKDGRTIVVVTHALDVARRAQRCITLLDGQVIKGQDVLLRSAFERKRDPETGRFTKAEPAETPAEAAPEAKDAQGNFVPTASS